MTKINKEPAREEKSMDTAGPTQSIARNGDSGLLAAYGQHLAHLDLPDEDKIALISSVRQIMGSFVDRAFGDDPVQHVRGIVDGSDAKDALASLPVVSSRSTRQPSDKARLASAFAPPAAARRGKETL